MRWQLRVPDFNLPPRAGENPSHVLQPLISQNSRGLKNEHLMPGDHPGMLSPAQGGSMGALGFLFDRAELSSRQAEATSASGNEKTEKKHLAKVSHNYLHGIYA